MSKSTEETEIRGDEISPVRPSTVVDDHEVMKPSHVYSRLPARTSGGADAAEDNHHFLLLILILLQTDFDHFHRREGSGTGQTEADCSLVR
jgi:hypothetical protein